MRRASSACCPGVMRWASSVGRCLGPKVYAAPPDGDWGWAVAASFFFVEIFTYGVIKSLGVFLQDLMSEFGETNNRVSWVVSISVFVMTFTAPLSSVLSNRFGFRPVVMLGGCLISLGTIATSFTQSVNQMYLTTGIISGLGYCLTFLPTVTILSQYFSRRRSLVTAFASTGECFSIFTLAPALTALKERIGWRKCLVVVGVLQGSIVICGALLRPIIIKPAEEEEEGANTPTKKPLDGTYALENEETRTSLASSDSGVQSLSASRAGLAGEAEEKTALSPAPGSAPSPLSASHAGLAGEWEEKTVLSPAPGSAPSPLSASRAGLAGEAEEKTALGPAPSPGSAHPTLLDLSVLRDWSFLCYAIFGLFATLGFFAPQLYIIQLGASRGVTRETAAYMLSAMAVAEIAGRLSVGCVMNRRGVRKIYVLLACVSLLCVVLALFTAARCFWSLGACCVAYGFLLGTVCSTHIPMLAEEDVVGIRKMSSAAGIYVFIQSFACLGGPPLGGVLVDVTQNYGSAFYSCAVGMGIGALFLALVRPAKRWQRRARKEGRRERRADEEEAAEQAKQEMPADFLDVDVAMETSHTHTKQRPEEEV